MSSTIVTNRLAAVFENPKNRGDLIWVLFEKHFESNVYPHTPHWSVWRLGRIDGALRVIFSSAGDCEGGMLRDRAGHLLPEAHIDRWISKLRNPVVMADRQIELDKDALLKTLSFPWPKGTEERWAELGQRLTRVGREDLFRTLEEGGKPTLSLYDDLETVLAIFGDSQDQRALVVPWNVLGSYWAPESAERAKTRYFPAGGEIAAPRAPKAYRIDQDAILLERDGVWREAGWAYSIMGQFIAELYVQELHAPGSYHVHIPAMRKALAEAPLVPEGAKAFVDLAVCEDFEKADVYQLAHETGAAIEKNPETGEDAGVSLPWTTSRSHWFAYLPRHATTWHIPTTEE